MVVRVRNNRSACENAVAAEVFGLVRLLVAAIGSVEHLSMTASIATYRPLPSLSLADKIYIERNFYALEALCLGRPRPAEEYRSQIRDRLLPLPTYVVEGIEMYPADFFVFPDSVGALGAQMKDEFSRDIGDLLSCIAIGYQRNGSRQNTLII